MSLKYTLSIFQHILYILHFRYFASAVHSLDNQPDATNIRHHSRYLWAAYVEGRCYAGQAGTMQQASYKSQLPALDQDPYIVIDQNGVELAQLY